MDFMHILGQKESTWNTIYSIFERRRGPPNVAGPGKTFPPSLPSRRAWSRLPYFIVSPAFVHQIYVSMPFAICCCLQTEVVPITKISFRSVIAAKNLYINVTLTNNLYKGTPYVEVGLGV